MLTEKQLDQFLDEFWEDSQSAQTEAEQEISEENLEEYALPADGMIIRQMERKGKVSRRTWFALVLMLLVVPLLLYLSVRYFHGRKYLICSLIVIIAAMIPFFMMFEGRKPKAREIMVISVLAAIGVAGRAAFFMVPSFKPVAAIVILTGISFGGEAGFLVGCLIMMLSNMFMGQGPWTPWQMFAFGMIGFLAGILYQKGILKARKADLCIFGFLSVFLIYGGIMNPASALMAYGTITWQSLLAFYISGAPVDLVHALSTVIFLWFLSRPLLEKLDVSRKIWTHRVTERGNHLIYISHLLPDEEMKGLVTETGTGVESIDFSISDNLDHLGKRIELYQKKLEKMGNPPLILHGPFLDLNPAAFDSLIREVTMTRFTQCYQAGLELGAKKIVYHSGMIPCVYYREGWADQVSRFFTEFLEDKDDLEIVMENVLDEDWCLLLDVYKKVDHPKFKLCLDMGHAHCYSEIPVMEWAEGLSPYIGHVHVHDNAGDRDSHLGLGKGTLPYHEVLKLLPVSKERTWTIECSHKEDVLLCIQKIKTEGLL